jgi:hypothetical protein
MQQVSMLRILLATSERALEAFRAASNPVDQEFVADLERIVERTRAELEASVARNAAKPS